MSAYVALCNNNDCMPKQSKQAGRSSTPVLYTVTLLMLPMHALLGPRLLKFGVHIQQLLRLQPQVTYAQDAEATGLTATYIAQLDAYCCYEQDFKQNCSGG